MSNPVRFCGHFISDYHNSNEMIRNISINPCNLVLIFICYDSDIICWYLEAVLLACVIESREVQVPIFIASWE